MNQLTLILLSVALIGMVCLPLILNHFKQKNKGNLLKEKLKSEAQVENLNSGDIETWRENYCMGLDQENQHLIFLNGLDEGESRLQKIDLALVRLCRPIRNFRETIHGKEKRRIINKVSLVLDRYDEQAKPFTIDMYDEDQSDYMINEWELAQSWAKRINDLRN